MAKSMSLIRWENPGDFVPDAVVDKLFGVGEGNGAIVDGDEVREVVCWRDRSVEDVPARCKCGRVGEFVEFWIHDGVTKRIDCVCGRFISFPVWYVTFGDEPHSP